jgi:hypothetical protein
MITGVPIGPDVGINEEIAGTWDIVTCHMETMAIGTMKFFIAIVMSLGVYYLKVIEKISIYETAVL